MAIPASSALANIGQGLPEDISQVHDELSWIESRALDAGNTAGQTMAGPLTVPGLIVNGASVNPQSFFYFGTDTGPVNTLSVTTTFPNAMAKGLVIAVKVGTTNAGPATLNVNSLGAYSILQGGVQLSGGELPANGWTLFEFDGSYWNVLGMAPGGNPNVDVKMYAFPPGTRLIFNQGGVPPGWTQDTSVLNDALLCMTNGSGGGTYGANAVSSVLRGGSSSDGTVISVAQMPGHNHGINDPGHSHGVNDPGHDHTAYVYEYAYGSQPSGAPCYVDSGWNAGPSSNGINSNTTGISIQGSGTGVSTQGTGGGAAHSHTLSSLNVSAIYNIVGVKN